MPPTSASNGDSRAVQENIPRSGFASRQPDELAQDIKSPLLQQQGESVIGAGEKSPHDSSGEIPQDIRQTADRSRAARKPRTRAGTAFGIASGVVVDTHVQRISHRLDLTQGKPSRLKIEKDLMKIHPERE